MGYRVWDISREDENVIRGEDQGDKDRAREKMAKSGLCEKMAKSGLSVTFGLSSNAM